MVEEHDPEQSDQKMSKSPCNRSIGPSQALCTCHTQSDRPPCNPSIGPRQALCTCNTQSDRPPCNPSVGPRQALCTCNTQSDRPPCNPSVGPRQALCTCNTQSNRPRCNPSVGPRQAPGTCNTQSNRPPCNPSVGPGQALGTCNTSSWAEEHDPEQSDQNMSESPGNGSIGPRQALCTCIIVFLLVVGVTVLTLWLVYRPHKPQFKVVGAAIYELNTSAPPLISTTMQFTVVTRNPNRRVSIYYDRLSVFVSYRNQAITPQVMLPPFFHRRHSTVVLLPLVCGEAVPVSLDVANGLLTDEAYGVVGLRLVFLGSVRWKAGAIKTWHYGVYANCDVLVGLKKGFVGQVPLLRSLGCEVDI